ncbi:MAG: hypothetical protein ACON47_05705 [Flavobacteriaceae bacterium]
MDTIQIPIQFLPTEHICCQLLLNDKPVFLLIDTGATNSCIAFSRYEFYSMKLQEESIEAAGAGLEKLKAQKTEKAVLRTQCTAVIQKFSWMVLDLAPINTSLEKNEAPAIDGILGADVLRKRKACIDYDKDLLTLQL